VTPIAVACLGLTAALPATAATTALPTAPLGVKVVGTLTGVDLSFTPAPDANDQNLTAYVIHRVVNGVETTFPYDPAYNEMYVWHRSENIPGASYSVSAVNADGEGPSTAAVTPAPVHRAITVGQVIRLENQNTWTIAGQIAEQGGTQIVPLLATDPGQIIDYIAASPDGREITFAKGQASLWRVRADDPTAVPVKLLDGHTGIRRLAWSPDGTRIAIERLQPNGSSCVEIIAATGGTPFQVGCSLLSPSWTPSGRLVVRNGDTNRLQVVEAKATGRVLDNIEGTDGGSQPAVSPDGRWVAFAQNGGTPAVIPITGGTAKLGTPTRFAPDSINWSPDGTSLLLAQDYYQVGSHVLKVPVAADGTPGPSESIFKTKEVDSLGSAVWQQPRVFVPASPASTSSELRVPFDTTALAGPVTTTCQLDGAAATPCTSPYVKSGLSHGTHRLVVKAVDGFGQVSVAAAEATIVDTTAPQLTPITPAADVTTASVVTVGYGAKDASPIASYDVRWRIASAAGPYGAYAAIATATKATSVKIGAKAGYEYCVSVRARDVAGNQSAWSADRCFASPADDRAMTVSKGWTRPASSLFYAGTASQTKSQGVSITYPKVQAKRLFLLATKCATCGQLTVYYNGRRAGTIDLRQKTLQYQAIVLLPVPSTVLTGSVQLTTLTTGTTQIDGLAVRKS